MPAADRTPESDRLEAINPFFSAIPTGTAEGIPEVLRPIAQLRSELRRTACRITLFGAIKTGKSSLVNALLGADLVPVHAFRTPGVVTTVRFAPEPSATVVRQGGEVETVPLEALPRPYGEADGRRPIEELRLLVPLPILEGDLALVDTPGLLGDAALAGITYRELLRTDLAVMVLAADKILSTEERAIAAWVGGLLHGNIVYIVNRLDLVDSEDRENVLDWARTALRDSGNDLVGRPLIAATAAGPFAGPPPVFAQLAEMLGSAKGGRIRLLSRLGILEHRLTESAAQLTQERDAAALRVADARDRHLERVRQERAAMRRAVAEARVGMNGVRDDLPSLGEGFVSRCVESTRQALSRHGGSAVHPAFEQAAAWYMEAVREAVGAALSGAPVTAPRFEPGERIFRLRVDPVDDPASRLGVEVGDLLTRIVDGGKTGREAGAAIGGWIGKNVLHIDAEAETLKQIERLARSALHPIRQEAEAYIASILTLLDEAGVFYETWTRSSREVEHAESGERYWAALLQWTDGFTRAVCAEVDNLSVSGPL